MNWRTFRSRILLVGVAFPVLGCLILVLPHLHHLGFNLVVTAAAVLGGFETSLLFQSRKVPTARVLAPILAAALPAAAWLEVAGILPQSLEVLVFPVAFGVILVRSILFQRKAGVKGILAFASSSVFAFLYPGFFLAYIVRLSGLPDPSLSILFFLCLVFGNDMAAYFAGSLWGKSTRLNLPVSPQKSAVGFIAGIVGSFIILGIFLLAVPGFLTFGIAAKILLTLAMGIAVILGDLIESGLKRAAGVKDSGIVIPARGGMLDSVDSMILSAPLFYYFFTLAARWAS